MPSALHPLSGTRVTPQTSEMRVCIYCLEKKPSGDFNREHVIPEAFGVFKDNLVLDCVCKDCNSYFGETVDVKLARDSIEGLERFRSGMKPTSEFKSLGRRSTTTVRFKEDATQGALGYLVLNKDGPELRVQAFPQLGFEQPPSCPMKWFARDEVPEKSALAGLGFDTKREVLINVREMSAEDASRLLEAKGFGKLTAFSITTPPDDIIETLTVGILGRPEKRAATKIALNYLASVVGPALPRAVQFDDVRNFARHDLGESRVHVSENPWGFRRDGAEAPRGHYLAVQTMPSGAVIAQVSLMLKLRYVVHLSNGSFLTGVPRISSGHFFDLDEKVIKPIPVMPLVPAKQLRVAVEPVQATTPKHAPPSPVERGGYA